MAKDHSIDLLRGGYRFGLILRAGARDRAIRLLGRTSALVEVLIPQGGGPPIGRRCPGERVASPDYTVPPQDLTVSLRRMPTGPGSGFVITQAKVRTHAGR